VGSAPLPPGPEPHFLVGHLPEIRRGVLDFFTRCAAEYGDVTTVRFGLKRIILLTHPDHVEQVLVSGTHNFRKRFFGLALNRTLVGNGLFISEGDFWRRQRRLVQPAFHKDRIAAYGEVMATYAQRMAGTWRDGETLDAHAEMVQLTVEVVAKALFDADIAGEAHEIGAMLATVMELARGRLANVVMIPERIPTPANLRMRRAVARGDDIIYRIIDERRASREDKGDLLSMLLHAQDEDGSRMTDRQLRDEVMTLIVAGHETTAATLSWAWYLLSQHPDVEARLHAELQTVLGGRAPTVADLPRLQYTEQVVTESMRLYPPIWVIGREAVQDCEIGGYRVPAGTTVLMSQWVVHRDARFYENPMRFDPERWANREARQIPKYAYFPFGGGQRLCVGSSFAMMEGVLVLATLAQQFRLTLAPGHVVRPRPSMTLRPRYGVKMVVHRR
jgi:cytochrome P450